MRSLHHRTSLVRFPLAACLSGILLLASPGGVPAADPPPAGTPASVSTAPDFSGQGVDGKTYRLSELLTKGPVLIDFWTTWCKPCMQELPHLQKIHDKYKARGFTLLGVASDDPKTAAKIRPTIQSKGLKFPNVTDQDRRINNLYNVRNYPTTVLVAPNGRIALVAQGYRPGDEVELEKRIVELLVGAGTPGSGAQGSGASGSAAPGAGVPGAGVPGAGVPGAGEHSSESHVRGDAPASDPSGNPR